MLPQAVFSRLSATFHTPVVNLIVTGTIDLIAIFLASAPSTSVINLFEHVGKIWKSVAAVLPMDPQKRSGVRS